ncbi:MAG: type II secretion system protein GspE, partial [Synergistaceae bacterium]
LCPNCKREHVIPDVTANEIGVPQGTVAYEPVGCPSCRFTGYSGRTVISEMMLIDSALRDMINNASPEHEIRAYARKNGMRTLRESARGKVIAGITSVEEMLCTTMID